MSNFLHVICFILLAGRKQAHERMEQEIAQNMQQSGKGKGGRRNYQGDKQDGGQEINSQ